MMLNIIDFISQFIKFGEVRAETEDAEDSLPEIHMNRGYEWLWPRLLFFNSNSTKDEDEEKYESPSTEICIEIKDSIIKENDEDEEEQEQEQEQDQEEEQEHEFEGEEDICTCPEVGIFRRKLGCIYRNAKFGLREGALTGVFLGGAFGIYKYVDAVYIKGESSEGGEGTENGNESTVNDNIIFVTAANGAIAMAVFCTILCCSRGIIYC